MFLVLIIFILHLFLKGGKGFDSVLGFKYCSDWYFLVYASVALIGIICNIIIGFVVIREAKIK